MAAAALLSAAIAAGFAEALGAADGADPPCIAAIALAGIAPAGIAPAGMAPAGIAPAAAPP